MKTKFRVMVVPDNGSYYLTLPESLVKALGWREHDILEMDIPMTNPDQVTVTKKNV